MSNDTESDTDGKTTQSAGRGMLVDADVPEAKREAMAEEMEAEIRDKRRDEWQP